MAWQFKNKKNGNDFTANKIVACWEVALDPISDNYTLDEISAHDLFELWIQKVRKEYPNGLVPIRWYVKSHEEKIAMFEAIPYQYNDDGENFLTHFTLPINGNTQEPMNWFKLPVADKLWREKQADKGGFIQEATGWKPSILQPYIHLSALEKASNIRYSEGIHL